MYSIKFLPDGFLTNQVAVQEVRRLQRYGVTKPELERYQMALLRDAEQAAEQSTSIPSVEMLEYSMDSIGLDHTVMDQAQVRILTSSGC